MKKCFVTTMLAVLMVLSMVACQSPTVAATTAAVTTTETATTQVTVAPTPTVEPTPTSKYPSYLNLDSILPVIKTGEGTDITLKLAINQPASGGMWKDLWVANYIEKFFNVKLEVEQIVDSAVGERKTLLFASNDLPDMMMNLNFTPVELLRYGVQEKQLLALDGYLAQDLTPNIEYWFGKKPDAKAASTTPDGHIYTLPMISDMDPGGLPRLFINQTWLEACNLTTPTTLDDFIKMAEAFKQMDPGKVGADNVVPIGGGLAPGTYGLGWYFLNALGYTTIDPFGTSPAVRNNACELPCGNKELFLQYLTVMKKCYDEGLFSKSFFTLDNVAVNAQLLSGCVGVYQEPVYTTGLTTWADWWAAKPLTSQWNPTPVWNSAMALNFIGGFVMSAKTKYPELCLRFADYYFSPNARIMWIGAKANTPEAMGWENTIDCMNANKYPDGITDIWTYLMAKITPQPLLGSYNTAEVVANYNAYLGVPKPDPNKPKYDLTNADMQYRAGIEENMVPYCGPTFPAVYYLTNEQTTRLSDLGAAINPYVQEQVSKFIKGDRPLSEFDAYIAELQAMKFDEYQKFYQDIWADYLKSKS